MAQQSQQRLYWSVFLVSGLLLAACAPRHRGVPPARVPTPNFTPPVRPASPPVTPAGHAAYGKLPLMFEANQGQSDPSVQFLARGRGYALFLTPSEAVLSLQKGEKAKGEKGEEEQRAGTRHQATGLHSQDAGLSTQAVRLQLANANPQPRMEGLDALPGKVNYFLGNDPSQWRTNVPTYAKVKYHDVYPGIDVVYYGNQEGKLEHDFIVAPGADPSVIQFSLRDQAGKELPLTADAAGNLLVQVADATLRLGKPVVYQEIGGERRDVAGSYTRLAPQDVALRTQHSALRTGGVGFQVASYDPAYPVIIDPVLVYSTYLGGSSGDEAYGIAVDGSGQAYVVGYTASTNFPTAMPLQAANAGSSDAFVAKLSADGQTLLYATYIGGTLNDDAYAVAIDGSGQAYVTGSTDSVDFPTASPFQAVYAGGMEDGFVAKLSADGTALLYATYLGGSNNDFPESIAVDGSGQAYVTGSTDSVDFPTASPFQAVYAGGTEDGFVTKLSMDGTALLYSTYLGGSGLDFVRAIAVDESEQVRVAGVTESTDFPTAAALQATNAGKLDGFVAKLSASGTALVYATYLGGSEDDAVASIARDGSNQMYVTGFTASLDFPTMVPLQAANAGSLDIFVAKLSADGTTLHYSTYLGGSSTENSFAIAVDGDGQAYVAGFTLSTDFPTVAPLQMTKSGIADVFVTKLSADGMVLLFASYLGGSDFEEPEAIAVDGRGQVYVAGLTGSADFPTVMPLQATNADGGGGFVVKLDLSPDTDGDGLSDAQDNCPDMQNAGQLDGDGDSIGDGCDADQDDDGVPDSSDSCPMAWNPLGQNNDRDGDGVADACDNCFGIPNADQLDADHNGRGDLCEIDVELPEPNRTNRGKGKPSDPTVTDSDGDGLTDAVEDARGLSRTNPDSDGDGVRDGTDNCPLPGFANPDQKDTDHDTFGDVCDGDDDGDFVLDADDNCPLVANTDQRNMDADGEAQGEVKGDACDDDADGDTFRATAAGGDDCNDLAATVYPGAPEIPGNNRDDDCDTQTPDRQLALVLDVSDPADPKATAATWLPIVGRRVMLTARVVDDLHQSVESPVVTLSVGSRTTWPGQYTNDDSQDVSPDYVVESNSGNQAAVRAMDDGGSLVLFATARLTLADGTLVVLQENFTLPSDRDRDGLPDAWEDQFGDLDPNEDFDTSMDNRYLGDGLTAFEEYRGFVWGPALVRVGPNATYQTPVYVPQGAVQHFRSHPFRKDVFLTFRNYNRDSSNLFAVGTAFSEDVRLDLHVRDAAVSAGEAHIDVVELENNLTGVQGTTDGHINKRGVRDWEWDTKGESEQGDATTYGSPVIYQKPLDYYFTDRPYVDGVPQDGQLNPVTASSVEDKNDNGVLDVQLHEDSAKSGVRGVLDGDRRERTVRFDRAFSALDVDQDGRMELPVVNLPSQIDPRFEYTKAQVLMHTISHEVGHALGMRKLHDQDTNCLMYDGAPNWSRAHCFSPGSKAEIQVHNE